VEPLAPASRWHALADQVEAVQVRPNISVERRAKIVERSLASESNQRPACRQCGCPRRKQPAEFDEQFGRPGPRAARNRLGRP